jgi:hypothetical protein
MVCTLLGLGAWHYAGSPEVPLGYLLACAFFLHMDNVGAQLAVRATLLLTMIAGVLTPGTPLPLLAAGCALLVLGSAGLGERHQSVFAPTTFRRSLMVSLVIAFAQLELLALLAVRHFPHHPGRVVFDLACAAVVGFGAIGVYRLRIWGLIVQVIAAIGLAVLVGFGSNRIAGVIVLPLVDIGVLSWSWWKVGVVMGVMAAAQLFLAVPRIVSVARESRASAATVRATERDRANGASKSD